jgi:peptide/nickel transport system substrate-binding protein
VGNGPFKVGTYDSQGQRYVFTRFDDYYWKGLPYLDEVEFRWGIDQSVQLLMMQRGEVDLMGYGLNAQSLAETRASDRLKKYRFEQPLLASRWINTHPRVEAFRDPRVRQALNWATDRDQLERVTGGEAVAWGAPFPKDILGGKRTFQPYTLDLDKARSLLSEAGSPQIAFTLWVSDSPEPQVGQVLQQQWKEIGVDVTLKQASYATINDLSIKDKCDSWVSTYYAIYPTAIDVISQYWETGGSANYTHYSNADVDRLTTEARATNDPNARNALLAQVEQKVGEDAAGVFCENVNWIMARNPDRLRNFSYSGVYGAYYDRLWVAT